MLVSAARIEALRPRSLNWVKWEVSFVCANVRTLVCYESAGGAVFMGLPGVRGRSCDLFRALNGPGPVLRTLTQPERR